jgi:hypothetical protein
MWTLVIWQLAMGIGNWQLIGYWLLTIDYEFWLLVIGYGFMAMVIDYMDRVWFRTIIM